MPSYISPNELLSITTFDEPNKDAVVEVINSKTKTRLKDNENEKAPNEIVGNIGRKGFRLKRLTTEEEETEIKDNMCEIDIGDNTSKQSSKKRKYSLEKSVTDESDVKVKKKKKEIADQNIIDQDEGKKISKSESEDKNNTLDNESDAADNKQKFKKRKYSSEKLFVADESQEKDIKVKKKKKATDQNITYQQNENEKIKEESKDKDNTCDNDVAYNNDKQSSKKEKYALEKSLVADENDVKVKKRRKTVDQSTIDQQDEKEMMPKEDSEDKTNAYDDETDTGNNGRQSLKKKKLVPEKSYIKDERDSKVTGNSMENQEIPNKNRNKVTEKKKRRLTINDTITTEDDDGETVKKECRKSAINLNKNETTELEYPHEGDDNDEASALLQTEKHSTNDFGTRNSDIEEISDERKKKKNRKKRNKIQDNDICSKIGLQIMAKLDWKRLRNRYLDLQRYKMKQLKMHLRKAEVERDGIIKNGYHDKTGQINTLHDKSKHENDNETFEEKSCGRVNYAPGIIVKIEMDEPCTDTQSFKVYSYH